MKTMKNTSNSKPSVSPCAGPFRTTAPQYLDSPQPVGPGVHNAHGEIEEAGRAGIPSWSSSTLAPPSREPPMSSRLQ